MSLDRNHRLCWIGLSTIPGVGRTTFRKLVRLFGSACAVLAASRDELRNAGASERVAREIAAASWREYAEQEIGRAGKAGVDIITADDEAYPRQLRASQDAPLFLYVRGSLLPQDREAVAVVGTRTPSHAGLTLTHRMAHDLAAAGLTVVSGLARGIDTQAHKGALAGRGRTIAVLACGIDRAYPPENRDLMERIAEQGAVVTENPFGTPPESGYFPGRNRIISGLAAGTVVVEAAADSGSLITADCALQQGRKLFAVPGVAGSAASRGSNNLIRQGAVLVETAEDVLLRLGRSGGPARTERHRPLPDLTADESAVLQALTADPKHIDLLLVECGRTAGALGGILTALELKGAARQLPGKYFVRDGA